jgi:glycosyltransferase involved in cell wall biosynthesis
MAKRKILYVCHNHPNIRPGGTENYALNLYQAMKGCHDFEPIFLARGPSGIAAGAASHAGTLVENVDSDPNQFYFLSEIGSFDWFNGTCSNKQLYTKYFREFLQAVRPDVVHFQHTAQLGYDMICEVRQTLPRAGIVYTLHEYMPICHRQGQMMRTLNGDELCTHDSPRRCNECFPEHSPQAFFMRKRFVQSHFEMVDMFLSPSRFLLERYVAWGIPRSKIRLEENGRLPVEPQQQAPVSRRNRFAFFGQINPFKGVTVLLRAMQMLRPDDVSHRLAQISDADLDDCHLWIHGANLELQTGAYRKEVAELLEATRRRVTMVGRYDPSELPHLMSQIDWVIVPSIWWENAPLVIQEAFQHGRPVICSDIGGMAEKVAHGKNGLHFRAGDARSLAETLRMAATTPELWEQLRSNIPVVYRMDDHIASLRGLYEQLIQRTNTN